MAFDSEHSSAEFDDAIGAAKGDGRGLMVKLGTGNGTRRVLQGTENQIVVEYGDGLTGNPVFRLADAILDDLASIPAELSAGDIASMLDQHLNSTSWRTGGGGSNYTQATNAELTAGTLTEFRSYTPADIRYAMLAAAPVTSVATLQGAVTATALVNQLQATIESTLINSASFAPRLVTQADKTKLAGIQDGAQVNASGTELVAAITNALGSTVWTGGPLTPSQVVVAVNQELGGTDWALPPLDGAGIETVLDAHFGNSGWKTGGNDWSTQVDHNIIPDANDQYSVGVDTARMSVVHTERLRVAGEELTVSTETLPNSALVGASDAQTLTNKVYVAGNRTRTGSDYTVSSATESSKLILSDRATAQVCRIPTDAADDWPETYFSLMQYGLGSVTIQAQPGVILNKVNGGSCVINNQFDTVYVEKIGANTWVITGAHGGVS